MIERFKFRFVRGTTILGNLRILNPALHHQKAWICSIYPLLRLAAVNPVAQAMCDTPGRKPSV